MISRYCPRPSTTLKEPPGATSGLQENCVSRTFELTLIAVMIILAAPDAAPAGDEPGGASRSERIPVADGSMVVCWKADFKAADSLLIHFHGALDTVERAYTRSSFSGVLAVVNFPGLSSAYSTPVAEDPRLFDWMLMRAWTETHDAEDEPGWDEISLSSFSAGYGAVRTILKTEAHFDRIRAIVAADSIYAGLETTMPDRIIDADHMRDFLRFARLAVRDERRFILSHSAQPTPYASTTETADHLLRALNLERLPETIISPDGLEQVTGASRGGFRVLGCAGTTGPDHLKHLHHIDLLWDLCFSNENSSGEDPAR